MKDKILELRKRYFAGDTLKKKNVQCALNDIRTGWPVIIVDDFDRENEGDLMLAGDKVSRDNIAFMCRWGRGIMCLPSSGEWLDRLQIPQMVQDSTDPYNTAFTVSVDAIKGISTGVSASDRVKTIQAMCSPTTQPEELARPGHLFPLRARDNLLLDRRGHTESSVALLEILDFSPVAIISEIMNDDGSMARLPELEDMAMQHRLQIVSIEDICEELGL